VWTAPRATPSEPATSAPALSVTEVRRRRREWGLTAILATVLALVFVFEGAVLGRARSLPIGSDTVFFALVHVNVLGIGLLAWLLSRNVVKLVIDRRRGIVGSKLNTKFVVSFVFTAAISTTGLFLLSAFVVSHTIGKWHQAELSTGLRQALKIAEQYHRDAETRLRAKVDIVAREVSAAAVRGADRTALEAWLEAQRLRHALDGVGLFDPAGAPLAAAADPDATPAVLAIPELALVEAGREGRAHVVRETLAAGDLMRTVASVRGADGREVAGFVIGHQYVPGSIGARALAVRAALDAYRRLEPATGTFQGSMLLLLAMLTLVSLLFSTWMGFRLAKQIADPIQRLAGAAAELAAGHMDVRVEQRGDDEIGHLVAAFNRMATDLQASRDDLERRRALMEVVLGGVGAGVVSVDRADIVTTVNASAARLLDVRSGRRQGCKLSEMVEGEALALLESLLAELRGRQGDILRRQLAISAGGRQRILSWTVSELLDGEGGHAGAVVLIDDVTQIISAQRTAAWRDVARRIAHEIKNPLTPIQLSAQRLRRKLAPDLASAEAKELLSQCTDAITGQVEAMKVLVTEFSKFAALPATDPTPTRLNELVAETVAMYKGKPSIEFATRLAPDLPELDLDREQIKRVILNLVDNAMCAIEAAGPGPRQIVVTTRVDRAVGIVQLEVADTGCGIAPEDRGHLFEPGFSTKDNGTGIGLAIVSRIVSDHSGYIRVRSNRPRGARFVIELPARV
jgi:two-component system nitrogen regulation sensor histidine kinase NtrY